MKTLLALAVLAAVCFVAIADPSPPVWPSSYTVKGIFHVPLAPNGGIHEPVTFIYDAPNQRVRMEYYGGEVVTLLRYDTGKGYEITPRVDKLVCYTNPSGDFANAPTVLPDLSEWTYVGTEKILGTNAHNFQFLLDAPEPTNYTSAYNFYVDADTGAPVAFNMKGYNIIWGAHPDIYSFVFQSYQPNFAPARAFDPPSLCDNPEIPTERRVYRQKAKIALFNVIKPVVSEDAFDHFSLVNFKHYPTESERLKRRNIWAKNIDFIKKHNANPNKKTKLAVNRFADLTPEERRELYGIKFTKFDGASRTHVYNRDDPLPPIVDWRKKGVVTQVKDQGVCGSCWTFGATAAFEGAYALKYGQLIEFSEQHILDCAYVGGNMGCDGGTASAAYDWLLTTDGLATSKLYPYRMQNSFCKPVKKGVPIASYVNITSGDELALQHAVATVGPVTVAINTDDPLWYYHIGEGVYDSDNCPGGLDDLDHQVTVVGYGTTADGIDYWIVKNSYGPFWGERGYIKMRRNKNNLCGIATQANYVVFN